MLLYTLHTAAFIIHLISSILSLYFHISEADSDVRIPKHIYANNSFMNTTYTNLMTVNPVSLVTLNEMLTAFSHLIALWLLRGRNLTQKKINNFELNRRTFEYCFTAGILQCALVTSVGAVYLHDLVFLLLINVVIQLLGVSIDMSREFVKERGDARSFGIPWFFAMAFGLLMTEIIYVLLHCLSIDAPDTFTMGFFVAMGIIYGILYISFGLVKVFVLDDSKANEIYVALSVTTKIVLSWVLIGNLHYGFSQLFDANNIPESVVDLDYETVLVVVVAIFLFITIDLIWYIIWCRPSKDDDEEVELVEIGTNAGTNARGKIRYDLIKLK